jgi:hypothetical protein
MSVAVSGSHKQESNLFLKWNNLTISAAACPLRIARSPAWHFNF